MLTERELKGKNFENLIEKKLSGANILYKRNTNRGKGVDFKTEGIEIEAKFSHAKIFPSWIRRDYITRFSKNAKTKVIVTNRGMKLTEESHRLLRENNILVVFYDALIFLLNILLGVTKLLNCNRIERYNRTFKILKSRFSERKLFTKEGNLTPQFEKLLGIMPIWKKRKRTHSMFDKKLLREPSTIILTKGEIT
jgi:hypothetical protein